MPVVETLPSLSRSPGDDMGLSSSEDPQKKMSLTGGREVAGARTCSWEDEDGGTSHADSGG